MLIYEFRIPLPISVEEYQVAQLYAVAEASKGETGGGEGVEVLDNYPYPKEQEKKEGQYTNKIYHLQSKVPAFVRAIAPKGALAIREEAWNAYPYCRTVLTNEYMKDKFSIEIITWHKPDLGTQENVHGLDEALWKKCKVVNIDIAAKVDAKDYKEEEDPTKVRSTKADRGPLSESWLEDLKSDLKSDPKKPHMCCYKLVKADFRMFGFQGRIEDFIQRMEQRLFTTFHRKLFCSMDEWYGMTMEDIRRMEEETKKELDEMRMGGEVKGTTAS